MDGKPFGDVTLPVVSLLRGRRMERLIGKFLGGDIEDLPLPFFCVSSNLGSGQSRCTTTGPLPLARARQRFAAGSLSAGGRSTAS